jgi:hypothetical protein
MDGSCRAALKKHSGQIHSSHRKQITEQLCGAARFARLSSGKSIKSVERSSKENESQQARLSSATITNPCLSDCGSCGSGFGVSDFRSHAVAARREQARPNPVTRISNALAPLLLALIALVRESPPRAPPITLS